MLELKADRVTKRFGKENAVDGVSFTLTNGVYGLLGENGAGKTTLLRMLCGLLVPDSGQISCQGQPIGRMGAEYRRVLGYLPQDFGYYPDFTAERYLKYLAQLKALPPYTIPRRLEEIWALTGLQDAKKQKLKGFSGGMLRRLGIGQALLSDPKVLILDEPTAGLDPKERIRFRNIISSLGRDRIVLLSTHIVQDVEFIADKVLLMKAGRLTEADSPQRIAEKIRGSVWECRVDEAWARRLSGRFAASNIKYEGGQVYLRIVSEKKPVPDAQACEPNLEDVYLYYAGERGKDGSVSDGTL